MSVPRTGKNGGRWQLELLLVAAIYLAYDGSRLFVGGGLEAAVRHARGLLNLEQWLRLDPERWLNSAFSSHEWLGIPADFAYATLHYAVTPAVLVWLWRQHRQEYRRARTWLGLTTVLALAGFVSFPTAPPRLLPAADGFTDTMAQHASVGWWSAGGSVPKGLGSMTNEFAAMPSLHVGWALWCGLLLFRCSRDRTVRTLGLLYPAVITLVVMGTGNHYLLDCAAGAALVVIGGLLSRPALRLADRLLAPAARLARPGRFARFARPARLALPARFALPTGFTRRVRGRSGLVPEPAFDTPSGPPSVPDYGPASSAPADASALDRAEHAPSTRAERSLSRH